MTDLKNLKAGARTTVKAAIETHLRDEPTKTSRSRIKQLRASSGPQHRLRVGDYVFYDLSDATVEILAIIGKSEAEARLTQFGSSS